MFGDRSKIELLTKRKVQSFFYCDDPINSLQHTVNHDIVVFDELVKKDFCQDLISFFEEKGGWQKSVTYGEMQAVQSPEESPRQSSQVMIESCPNALDKVHGIFSEALSEYRKIYEYVDINESETYSLLRYKAPSGEYKAHVDRGSSNHRCLSGLFYLNDDYEGGELHFPRQDYSIKPKQGSLIFFPSVHTHLHASLPIREGTKYAVVTWFK